MSTPEVSVFDGDGWRVIDEATIRGRARVDGSVQAQLLEAAGSGDLDAVLAVLVAGGVRSLPDFAYVCLGEDQVRVVARGAGTVVVEAEDGPRTIAHDGRGPWLDEDVTTPGPVRIGEPGEAGRSTGPAEANADADSPASSDAGARPTGWVRPRRFGRRPAPAAPSAGQAAQPVPASTPAPVPPPEAPAPGHVDDRAPGDRAPDDRGQDAPRPDPDEVPHSLSTGPAAVEEDELPSYDHLFGATQFALPTEIERIDDAPEDEHAPADEAPAVAPPSPELTMPPPPEDRPDLAGPAAPAPPPVEPPAPGGGLIASVPWLTGGPSTPTPSPAPPAPAARPAATPVPPRPPAAGGDGPAPVAPSPSRAVPPPPPPPPAPAPAPEPAVARAATTPGLDGPHVPRAVGDSQPMPPQPVPPRPPTAPLPTPPMSSSAPHGTPTPPPPVAAAPEPRTDPDEATVDRRSLQSTPTAEGGPMVLSVLCPAGHAGSPHSSRCRICRRDIPSQQPFMTPRPSLGTLRLSTGDVVNLDRGVLFGRQPKVNDDVKASDRPHLVRLASPDKDISRNHVEVILDGWHVLVRDLGSVNGTTVALPGEPAVRLRPSDQQNIEPGTVVGIADTVTFAYEVEG